MVAYKTWLFEGARAYERYHPVPLSMPLVSYGGVLPTGLIK